MRTPEILAPVGDWTMLRAAIHNGADAVYLGMPGFNARGRAPTLELSELKAMIEYAHLYGVRVLLAFNVLVFERELSDTIRLLSDVLPLAPDAFIVQDIGLVRLIRHMAPDQAVHASTQMTVTSAEAIALTEDLGMKRYVLGREVSMREMEAIRAKTTKELEVFVHGALCVSYSGQCLTSESMGGRSANRGQCAQSCRLGYDLVVDGHEHPLGARRYLVSPQDLSGITEIPELVRIGIDSFKIEGRLKSPAYVASTTRAYKERSLGTLSDSDLKSAKSDMAKVYSRGFFSGWLHGVDHQQLVGARTSSHHGLLIGEVNSVDGDSIVVQSTEPVTAGEGVAFLDPDSMQELGGNVYGVTAARRSKWRLTFGRDFDTSKVTPGMLTYVNSSPKLESELGRTYLDRSLLKRIPIQMKVSGRAGESLTVRVIDIDGNAVSAASDAKLEPAVKAALTKEKLDQELGALGGSIFAPEEIEVSLDGELFLHQRSIKELRRKLVAELSSIRADRSPVSQRSVTDIETWRIEEKASHESDGKALPELNVLIREISQLDQLHGLPLGTVYLDFEFGKEYGPAAQKVRELGYRVGIATTRIFKPLEIGHLKALQRVNPDEVLVRNLGALEVLRDSTSRLVGDFSLNVANSLTAKWFLDKGLSRICPSYDLNGEQLSDLLKAGDAARFEVTVHQYIPAFHMEHCVFAAFLSKGSSYKDCGRPCERHRVELRDSKGALHPLKADAECRNTMFNGIPQSAAKLVPSLLEAGIKAFRVEALFESPEELRLKLEAYARVIFDKESPERAVQHLGIVERYGVTDGQFYNIRTYSDRKKDFAPLSAFKDSADPGLRRLIKDSDSEPSSR